MIESEAELEKTLCADPLHQTVPPGLVANVDQRLALAPSTGSSPRSPLVPSFASLQIATQSRWTSLLSLGAHGVLVAIVVLFALQRWRVVQTQKKLVVTTVAVTPFIPATPLPGSMGGGGGGGNHEIIEASKGRLPEFAKTQLAPPQILRLDNPKLPVPPTVVMPDIRLPDATKMPDLGIPQSPQVTYSSQGSGSGSGFGSGSGGGIGSGQGNGIGPGEGGGYGGGVYHVGGGVSNPVLIYAPDPEFSEQARRAKYQGVCDISLIVDVQGTPQRIHVVRPLGMGLDEKAMEAVRQYRFKPALYKGKAVPVEVNIEVNFRIY